MFGGPSLQQKGRWPMDLELWQVDKKYERLRSPAPKRVAGLVLSLSEQSQQTPVLVVAGADEHHFVLIDGYLRVAALERLGRDTVEAELLSGSEADALVWNHGLRHGRKSNALEEAWLLQVLEVEHGLSREELSVRFGRSTSWVSRRLGLLEALPESIQAAVRRGQIQAQSAMKYLVPLARANKTQCLRLVEQLGDSCLSVRDTAKLYAAWRAGDAEQRERIVEEPHLYLRVDEEEAGEEPLDDEDPGAALDRRLLNELARLAGLCRGIRRTMNERERADSDLGWPAALRYGWQEAQASFHALLEQITEVQADAG